MDRHFLFLQGPHGPFFAQLARRLAGLGISVSRIGFNAGDRAFWPRALPFEPYQGAIADWPATLARTLDTTGATDLVLYGDTRAVHAQAIDIARTQGLRLHVFEEGYLRPYWVTYERGGVNGNSRLMDKPMTAIENAIGDADTPNPPARWGAMREHIFYGALYHFCVLAFNRPYRAIRPHRDITVAAELGLYLKLLALLAPHRVERALATRRVKRGGFPYHLVLLQLAHDASFRDHGPFADMGEFISQVISGFARGAPAHHHLVFKAHPLEDGRYPLHAEIRRIAARHGVENRAHFVRGGKLARLLDAANSAVTVNSTAAHQALWRQIPVKAFGRAIYDRPGLTSRQPIAGFFAAPEPPDAETYRRFRNYLLATSQIPGSFYSIAGRRQLMRRIIDLMLSDTDPYKNLERGKTATAPRLFAVENPPSWRDG